MSTTDGAKNREARPMEMKIPCPDHRGTVKKKRIALAVRGRERDGKFHCFGAADRRGKTIYICSSPVPAEGKKTWGSRVGNNSGGEGKREGRSTVASASLPRTSSRI